MTELIEDAIKAEEELGNRGMVVHYHLYLGLTSERRQIEQMASLYSSLFPRVVGLKLFASHSTGNMGITDEKEERNIFQTLTDLDYRGVLAVHAEKTSLCTTDTSHSLSRPAKSEIESVRDMIEFAVNYGQIQLEIMEDLTVPFGVLSQDGRLLWGNDEFIKVIVNK